MFLQRSCPSLADFCLVIICFKGLWVACIYTLALIHIDIAIIYACSILAVQGHISSVAAELLAAGTVMLHLVCFKRIHGRARTSPFTICQLNSFRRFTVFVLNYSFCAVSFAVSRFTYLAAAIRSSLCFIRIALQ